MAARQGFSAQISQASEDAKQKLLYHAPLKSSWFSNLNTTCTIKSAPPRTPEVLSLLSTKSGWLWKRNEQHVWQARWCCVVPHTFLYYFDAAAGQGQPPPAVTAKFQSQLNEAVKSGYGNRPHSGPRSSFNVFQSSGGGGGGGGGTGGTTTLATLDGDDKHEAGGTPPTGPTKTATTTTTTDKSPPAGIIDLECYTAVHRSSENEHLLELAGDDTVNPDLRSFYFYCSDSGEDEVVDWTQALLHNRHSQIQDELDAFREVSTGFASQLQELHSDLDFYKSQLEEKEDECYSVRSSAEEVRRTCFRIVEEALEMEGKSVVNSTTKEARLAYRRDLESVRDLGTVVPAVQLLHEYTQVLEESCAQAHAETFRVKKELQNISSVDATRVKELQQELLQKEQDWNVEKRALQQQVATLQQALANSQKLTEDAQQQVTSTKMEMTMYQNSTKQRLGELLTHKKILKKEVIDLRQKLDEVGSELSLVKHTQKTSMETVHQERKKSELLERYVERMESQVKVQQNMMELMSTASAAAASVQYMPSPSQHVVSGERSVASYTPRAYQSEAPGMLQQHHQNHYESPSATTPRTAIGSSYTTATDNESAVQREHNQLLQRAREMVLQEEEKAHALVDAALEEDDAKSHLSELTEDRTQKQFFALQQSSPAVNTRRSKVTPNRLPSYIGVNGESGGGGTIPDTPLTKSSAEGVESGRRRSGHYRQYSEEMDAAKENGRKLDTIMSASRSITSINSKLSVAQRARQQADTSSNSIRVKPQAVQRQTSDSGSLLGNLGKSLTEALDNSLGIQSSSESTSDEFESEDDDRDGRYRNNSGRYSSGDDVAHSDTGMTEVSVATTMSLQERQALQRAKQLAFLKEQGLIKNESNLRGGAGATTPSPTRTATRTSPR